MTESLHCSPEAIILFQYKIKSFFLEKKKLERRGKMKEKNYWNAFIIIFFILSGYLVINIQVTDNLGGIWYNL